MGYTPFDDGIVYSSLWSEPPATRCVFLTLWTLCKQGDIALCDRRALERLSNVSKEDFDTAIKCLESPDPQSRTPTEEGRRIVPVPGGWRVVNKLKYRNHSYSDSPAAIRQRLHRAKKANQNCDIPCDTSQTSVTSAYAFGTASEGTGGKGTGESGTGESGTGDKSKKGFTKPTKEELDLYCAKIGLPPAEAERFLNYYEANGWRVGKNPMKNWQAAMRNWKVHYDERNHSTHQHGKQKPIDYSKGF